MAHPLGVKYSYEIINRNSRFIVAIYRVDGLIVGSLSLTSESEKDEWIEFLTKLEIPLQV